MDMKEENKHLDDTSLEDLMGMSSEEKDSKEPECREDPIELKAVIDSENPGEVDAGLVEEDKPSTEPEEENLKKKHTKIIRKMKN